MSKRLLSAALAAAMFSLLGAFGFTSSASAAPACAPAGNLVLGPAMPGYLFNYTVSPDPWTPEMSGQSASVTVTGLTQASVPLTMMSYKTQSAALVSAFPQQLYNIDRKTLKGCETITFKVNIPACYYQIDFLSGVGLTDSQIQSAIYDEPVIKAMLGGTNECDFTEPPPPTTTTTTSTTTTTTTPGLTRTPTTPRAGVKDSADTAGLGAKSKKKGCSSVTQSSYKVRARQKNSKIRVTVKTTLATRPMVRLRGAGINVARRTGKIKANRGTVTFRITAKKAGRIRVTASGCAKVAGFNVGKAKRAETTKVSPSFTG